MFLLYDSGNQTIAQSQLLTLPHGWNAIPHVVVATLVCLAPEAGYVAGDEIAWPVDTASVTRQITVSMDATNIYVAFSTGAPQIISKSTLTAVVLTNASWAFRVRIFA